MTCDNLTITGVRDCVFECIFQLRLFISKSIIGKYFHGLPQMISVAMHHIITYVIIIIILRESLYSKG